MNKDIDNISLALELDNEDSRIRKLPLLLGDITEWCKDTFVENKNNPIQQIFLINQLNATLNSVNVNLASIIKPELGILALAQDQTQELKNSEEEYNEIVTKVNKATEQAKALEETKAKHKQKEEELDILKKRLRWVPPTELDTLFDEINEFTEQYFPTYKDFTGRKEELLLNIPSLQKNIETFSKFLEQENKGKAESLNNQLEELKKQKEDFDKELEDLEKQKKTQEESITKLKSEKRELQDKNNELTDQINALQKELSKQNTQLSASKASIKVLESDIEETSQKIEEERKNFDALDQRRQVLVKHYENNRSVAETIAAGNFPPRIQTALESAEKSLEEFDSAISEQLDLRERGAL